MRLRLENRNPTVDLTGRRFGKLEVVRKGGTAGRVYWHCRCDCGEPVLAAKETLLATNRRTPQACPRCVAAARAELRRTA